MSQDTSDHNLRAIRELILAAFTAEGLRRFLEDDRRFRPIVAEFGPGHGLTDMVDETVTYCRTSLLLRSPKVSDRGVSRAEHNTGPVLIRTNTITQTYSSLQ
jgi:hypothetical protein